VTTSDTPSSGGSPWTNRGFIAAAVIVGLIVIAGVMVAVLPSPDSDDGQQPPPTASATGSASPEPLPTTVPTAAPADVTWNLLGQVALPYSRSAGPREVNATTASGYAHTPTGALIAAAQLSTRAALSSGKEVYEPTITRQFVPSEDRDRLLGNLRNAPQQPAEPGELSQTAGFLYQSYTPDTAVIGLVDRAPGAAPRFHITTVTMLWRDGDWRMVAPPAGSWLSVNRRATDLSGVVEWGAR
jgi:hypothetical protein